MRRLLLASALLFIPSLALAQTPSAYRVVVLTMDVTRIVLSGGGILRRAADCACETISSGRAAALELNADGGVTRLAPIDATTPALLAAERIPTTAFVFARTASTAGDPSQPVEIRITVLVPVRTPVTDDIYLSTERSGYKPADLLMTRIDARHWTIVQTLPRGARFAYRFTRGSFTTSERDAMLQLPPAREIVAQPKLAVSDTVATWADIQ